MDADELRTLLNIYLNPEFEDQDSIRENLEEAGIDVESFIEEITFKLEKAEAERRLKEGQQFKNKYYTLLDSGEPEEVHEELAGALSYGFRNKSGELTEEEKADLEYDRKKIALIKKISGDNGSNSKG